MKTGRPKGLAIGSLLQMIKDMAPSSNFNDDIRPEVGPNETLTCPICLQLLDRHWTQCAAQLCVPTVFASGYVAVSHLSCPCCYISSFDHTHIRETSIVVCSILNSCTVKCPQGCNVQVKDFTKHLDHSSEVCTATQNPTLTVDDILQKPLEVPMTATERNVAGFLIKKMMASSDDNLLSIPTRGQVNIKP